LGAEFVTDGWHSGNAAEDGSQRRGWLVGHFIDPAEGVRSSKDVEIKWAAHAAGERRAEWTADDYRTTVLLLIEGEFRMELTGGSATLTRQGDYVMWGPGIDHSWQAVSDSVVMTIRWPSSP
jgi:quercetin dioxygenase-like cupin family protein